MADEKPRCGIVMPISAMADYPASHWADVMEILDDSIRLAGFEPSLVSDADEVSVIHKRIVQNIYSSPMVVCDISGRNPNVMFELGMRLAFDKPTVIVKDNITAYPFDTSPIEHISYPRDLRFSQILEFKEKLRSKICSTDSAAKSDPKYSTFLKHFGEFTIPKLDQKEIPGETYILEELRTLRKSVDVLARRNDGLRRPSLQRSGKGLLNLCMRDLDPGRLDDAVTLARTFPGVKSVEIEELGPNHRHLLIKGDEGSDMRMLEDVLDREFLRRSRNTRPNATLS